MLRRFNRLAPFGLAAAVSAFGSHERTAEACGGYFSPPQATERTVVTDHRMAFSISQQQTVLWDQIRYAGDPKEFAWVLPVRHGATVELSHDEWFAALDASTQPVISEPYRSYGGGGCALGGCNGSADSTSAGPGAGQVQIISQSVIGPYETVTLRATDPKALINWLNEHAYEIPPAIQPTIDSYTSEGFDFIALRLRPICNERSMKPVRIVSPGADATLPLRMIAAGVGARVGLTLYVISEGRYHPQNFPDAVIDYSKLTWDRTQSRSNYEELSIAAMGESNGRSWLTESANHPQLFPANSNNPGYYNNGGYNNGGYPSGGGYSGNPGLADAYLASCRSPSYRAPSGSGSANGQGTAPPQPCDRGMGTMDSGSDANVVQDSAPEASVDDAGDASDAGDGAVEASAPPDAGLPPTPPRDAGAPPTNPPDTSTCPGFDDLDVAMKGLHAKDVWVTRLRAVLPVDALSAGDLRLEPTKDPWLVQTNSHTAVRYSDQPAQDPQASSSSKGCATTPKQHDAFGSVMVIGTTILGLFSVLKRRRR